MAIPIHGEACYNQYIGALWLVDHKWAQDAVAKVRAGVLKARVPIEGETDDEQMRARRRLRVVSGVAVIPITGVMMKAEGKFADTGTVGTRRLIREARDREDVRAIMLNIDSPGGAVAGTQELAAEVRAARERKRVVAHIDDIGASAAYWVASQTERITANQVGFVGSIGVLSVIEDSSGMAEEMGLKVHAVASGERKADGVPGTEVTDEIIQSIQSKVDAIADIFEAEIAKGRGMSRARVSGVATGETWIASEAQSLGLVDKVESFDAALSRIIPRQSNARARRQRQISR